MNNAMERTALTHYLYAGTWGTKAEKCGAQAFRYDVETQNLTYLRNFGDYKSMSCFVRDGSLLFVCVETKTEREDLVLSYRILDTGELVPLGCAHTLGLSICHLEIDRANKYIFAVNMRSCSVAMLKYDDTGALKRTDVYTFTEPGSYVIGYSLNDRQNAAYPHCARMMPDGTHLCVCNVGSDKIYVFKIDCEHDRLIPCPDKTVTIDRGEGARHLEFSIDGKFAYMNTEMGCTVYAFAVNEDNSFTRLQKLSTLDHEKKNPEKGWCSVSVLSTDGKYLYVGNRGQNNVAGFAIGEDGMLTNIGFFGCYGVSPRGLSFGYDSKVMICSNDKSGTISVIAYDKLTGKLGRCIQIIQNIPGSANVIWGALEQTAT